jgi:hypothetical protein
VNVSYKPYQNQDENQERGAHHQTDGAQGLRSPREEVANVRQAGRPSRARSSSTTLSSSFLNSGPGSRSGWPG